VLCINLFLASLTEILNFIRYAAWYGEMAMSNELGRSKFQSVRKKYRSICLDILNKTTAILSHSNKSTGRNS
jgi:hypothetical protein